MTIKDLFEWQRATELNDSTYTPPESAIEIGAKYVVVKLEAVDEGRGFDVGDVLTLENVDKLPEFVESSQYCLAWWQIRKIDE